MSQLIYASGYGVDINEIRELLKDEYIEYSSSDIIEKLNCKEFYFAYFCGEKDLIYIPEQRPYEKALFNSKEEIDNYIYNAFKPILKENVSFEKFVEFLNDVFDWDYC